MDCLNGSYDSCRSMKKAGQMQGWPAKGDGFAGVANPLSAAACAAWRLGITRLSTRSEKGRETTKAGEGIRTLDMQLGKLPLLPNYPA